MKTACKENYVAKTKKETKKSLTVLEISNVLLQYNTGAAATTFVVNDPERNSTQSREVQTKHKISKT